VLMRVVRVTNGVGSGILAVMMLLIVADVSLGRIFGLPIKGTYEAIEYMMVIVVFLAMAYTAILKGHVVINVESSRIPQRIQVINDIVTYFISTVFCCLMAWQGAVQAQIAKSQHLAGALLTNVQVFPFLYVLVFGSALMGLVYFVNLLDSVRRCLHK
jgi:TRAP-type C4-dicarboxylate transport system permease small subunit